MVHIAMRKNCSRPCPSSPLSRCPQTPGSGCRCWWHPESEAPSSYPQQSRFVFRVPNSPGHPLPFKQHPTARPLLKSPESSTLDINFPHREAAKTHPSTSQPLFPLVQAITVPSPVSSLELPISKKLSGPPRLLWQPPPPPAGRASPAGCQNALSLSLPPANACFPLRFFFSQGFVSRWS